MQPTIVLVHGAFAESASWDRDPLALDPFSPIGISPIADISSTTDPLALEPLSPLSAGAQPIAAGFFAADVALGLPHPPGRDAPRAPAAVPS